MKDKEVLLIEGKIGNLLKGFALKSAYDLVLLLEKTLNTIMDALRDKIEKTLEGDLSKDRKIKNLLERAEHHKNEFLKIMNIIKKEIK